LKEQFETNQEAKVEFLSPDEKKSNTYTILLFDLLLSYDKNSSLNPLARVKDFFSWCESISTSTIRKKIFYYFLEKKVGTVPVIVDSLELPEPSIYREVNNLYRIQVLEPIVNSRLFKRRKGRPPTVYGLKGLWRPDDLIKAVETHNQTKSKSFVLISGLGQSIMEDYLSPRFLDEINMNEIVYLCHAECKGYYTFDIANGVADFLSNQGVKVWR